MSRSAGSQSADAGAWRRSAVSDGAPARLSVRSATRVRRTSTVGAADADVDPAGADVWGFSRYDDVRRILADPRLSLRSAPSAHVIPNVDLEHATGTVAILQDDGHKHLRLRPLLATEFTAQRMEAFRPRVASVLEDHLDALLAGRQAVGAARGRRLMAQWPVLVGLAATAALAATALLGRMVTSRGQRWGIDSLRESR
jgi:cytochrome P450